MGGVQGREGDAEAEGWKDGEGSSVGGDIGGDGEGRGGEIDVVWNGEDAEGSVEAELDGDEKGDDRILVGDADRRVDRLRGGSGSAGTTRTRTGTDLENGPLLRLDGHDRDCMINNTVLFMRL